MSDAWFRESDRKRPAGEPGWYPILICYDPQEGFFPGGAFWDGQYWSPPRHAKRAITHYMPIRFETEEEAEIMAYRHDPEI